MRSFLIILCLFLFTPLSFAEENLDPMRGQWLLKVGDDQFPELKFEVLFEMEEINTALEPTLIISYVKDGRRILMTPVAYCRDGFRFNFQYGDKNFLVNLGRVDSENFSGDAIVFSDTMRWIHNSLARKSRYFEPHCRFQKIFAVDHGVPFFRDFFNTGEKELYIHQPMSPYRGYFVTHILSDDFLVLYDHCEGEFCVEQWHRRIFKENPIIKLEYASQKHYHLTISLPAEIKFSSSPLQISFISKLYENYKQSVEIYSF